MLEWWLTAWSIITAFLVFDLGVSAIRKFVWPSDTDVFQELEKDPVLRRKFEETCRDMLADANGGRGSFESDKLREEQDEEERRREDEVRELLQVREMNLQKEQAKKDTSPERTSNGLGAGRGGISMEQRQSMEGLRPMKTRPSMDGRTASQRGRPSLDGRMMGMGMRRKSEMGAEMTLMEEGAGGCSTAPPVPVIR